MAVRGAKQGRVRLDVGLARHADRVIVKNERLTRSASDGQANGHGKPRGRFGSATSKRMVLFEQGFERSRRQFVASRFPQFEFYRGIPEAMTC